MLRSLITTAWTLLTATAATAQGMGGQFAEPLSWPTLRDQLVLIAPSEAQLGRIAAEHDVYLADFATLRDDDIAAFLKSTKGMGGLNPDALDSFGKTLAKTVAIRREIAELDDALFGRLGRLLGDTQQAGLERIGQRRHRNRLRTRGNISFLGGRPPEIEPMDAIDWASLTESDRAVVESALSDWEDGYASRLKTWAAAQDRAEAGFVTTLADLMAQQAKFTEDSPPSAPEVTELVTAFQTAQQEVRAGIRPHLIRLQQHISGGLESLAEVLPAEQRFAVIRATIPGRGLRNTIPKATRGARRAGTNADTMAEIEQLAAAWERDAVPLMIEALAAGWKDDAARDEMIMETSGDGAMSFELPKREHSEAVRTRWRARHDTTIEAIAALVPELDKKALVTMGMGEDAETSHHVESSTTVMVASSGGDDDGGAVVVASSVSSDGNPFSGLGNDLLTIPAIEQYVVDGLARDLDLETSQRSSLNALHATHEAARDAMETERGKERRGLQEEMRQAFMKDKAPNQATQMKWGMLMMQPISHEGLDELDAAFFDGAAALAHETALVEPWRMARIRQRTHTAGGMMSASMELIGVPDDRWKVDLFTMVERSDLDNTDRHAAAAAMEGWHAAATSLAVEIKEARNALDAGMHAMMKGTEAGGKVEIDYTAALEVEKLQRSTTKKRVALSQLTQQTADSIAEALADPQTFHLLWVKHAFPNIAATDPFSSRYHDAANTPELTDEQRGAIAMLRAEHDEAWWLGTEAAIDILSADREDVQDQTAAFFEAQQIKQEIDRHLFARREAALKRLEHLRSTLTEQQLAAAGGLTDPVAPRTLAMPF